MDKKELKKEAEKNIFNLKNNAIKISGKPFQITEGDYIQGYLDGAEPREKRIEELEKEMEELRSGCGMCYSKDKDMLVKAKEIIKELLDTQYQLDPYLDIFKDRILKAEQFLKE